MLKVENIGNALWTAPLQDHDKVVQKLLEKKLYRPIFKNKTKNEHMKQGRCINKCFKYSIKFRYYNLLCASTAANRPIFSIRWGQTRLFRSQSGLTTERKQTLAGQTLGHRHFPYVHHPWPPRCLNRMGKKSWSKHPNWSTELFNWSYACWVFRNQSQRSDT